jgi:hypothetical protein
MLPGTGVQVPKDLDIGSSAAGKGFAMALPQSLTESEGEIGAALLARLDYQEYSPSPVSGHSPAHDRDHLGRGGVSSGKPLPFSSSDVSSYPSSDQLWHSPYVQSGDGGRLPDAYRSSSNMDESPYFSNSSPTMVGDGIANLEPRRAASNFEQSPYFSTVWGFEVEDAAEPRANGVQHVRLPDRV